MDQTVPVLLLDLDGVLNPFAAATCPDGYQERVLFEGEEPVRFSRRHGDWIRELAEVGDVSWATGWGANANEFYLPLLGPANARPAAQQRPAKPPSHRATEPPSHRATEPPSTEPPSTEPPSRRAPSRRAPSRRAAGSNPVDRKLGAAPTRLSSGLLKGNGRRQQPNE